MNDEQVEYIMVGYLGHPHYSLYIVFRAPPSFEKKNQLERERDVGFPRCTIENKSAGWALILLCTHSEARIQYIQRKKSLRLASILECTGTMLRQAVSGYIRLYTVPA